MTKDDLPPLPRSPVQSWMIDDDGAQHPCLVAPTFSTEELQAYALAAIAAHDAKRDDRLKATLVYAVGEMKHFAILDRCVQRVEAELENIEREGA